MTTRTQSQTRCNEYLDAMAEADRLEQQASQLKTSARDILYPSNLPDSDDLLDTLITHRDDIRSDGRAALDAIKASIEGRIFQLKSRGYYSEREPSFLADDIHGLVLQPEEFTHRSYANLSYTQREDMKRRQESPQFVFRIQPTEFPRASGNYIIKLSAADVAGSVTGERLLEHVRNELGQLPRDGSGEFIALPTNQLDGDWRQRTYCSPGNFLQDAQGKTSATVTDCRRVVDATESTLRKIMEAE